VTEIRRCRHILSLSQRAFAQRLGVAIEAYRTWDAGRRVTPDGVLREARTLIEAGRDVPVALRVLADELHVHVRTLRAAAQDGRLAATFGARPYFGRMAAKSTRAAATEFMTVWYRRTYGRGRRQRIPVCRVIVPSDYATILVGLRQHLGVSQRELAYRIGAAGKAVVYQWESGKRKPSAVFWMRIVRLQRRTAAPATRIQTHVIA
jgi:DNA-binding transcriptional regulator YiaG